MQLKYGPLLYSERDGEGAMMKDDPEKNVLAAPSDEEIEETIYLCVFSVIVCNDRLGVTVDQLYNRNRGKYAKAASSHPYYDSITNSSCLAEQVERGQKLLGMYAVEGDRIILEILQKGWPSFCKAFNRALRENDMVLIYKLSAQTIAADDIDVSITFASIMQYFDYLYSKEPTLLYDTPIDPEDKWLYLPLGCRREILYGKEEIDKNLINQLLQQLGINPQSICRTWTFFADHFDGNLYKCILEIFKKSGLNPMLFLKGEIQKKTIESILQTTAMACGNQKGLDKKETKTAVWIGIIITLLVREYNSLKDKYFQLKKEKDTQSLHMQLKEAKKEAKKLQKDFDQKNRRIAELEKLLSHEHDKNRKIETEREHIISKAIKEAEKNFSKKEKSMQDEMAMLRDILENEVAMNRTKSQNEESDLSFEEAVKTLNDTPNLLYVCNDITGAATSKIRRLKELCSTLKFFTRENDPIPSAIDYIFFDYHLISHGVYYKIKNVGSRRQIPFYNIQSAKAEINVIEMAEFINKKPKHQ